MEFVNLAIITVADLKHVDEQIGRLETQVADKQAEVNSKVSNGSFDYGQTSEVVGTIMQQLEALDANDLTITAQKLSEMEAEHGELQVFQDLKGLYATKGQAIAISEFLKEAEVVETQIADLQMGRIEDYESINSSITSLEYSVVPEDLSSQVKGMLNEQLNDKIISYRDNLVDQLNKLLTDINWLGPDFNTDQLTLESLVQLNSLISVLISLQVINHRPIYPDTWWAIDCLLKPFVDRFNYHFTTNKQTNKISKPEWAFNYVEEFLVHNIKLMEVVINQAFKPHNLIMIYQVITSALIPIRYKISSMIAVLNENIENFKTENDTTNYDKVGRLLSHLIFELTSFDQRIRNSYKYNPHINDLTSAPHKRWLGLTADVLLQGDKERLGTTNWLNFESILANKRFKTEIIQDANSLEIDVDYEANEDEEVLDSIKPTYSALNIVKLFNNLTTHYNTMRMIKFQLKYVSTIQLKLLENYYDYLKSSLKKFDDTYNLLNVLNLIPGSMESINKQEHKDSMAGLQMLTGIFCLAQFIHKNLEQWSEELIFIQLWNAYKAVVQKKYSPDSTIFDTNFEQFGSLIEDIKSRFAVFFKKGIKDFLREYINSSVWDIQQVKDHSTEFGPLVTVLPSYLKYIEKNIMFSDYFIIVNDIVTSICALWYEYIVTNNKFTKKGADQLEQDFSFIIAQLSKELLLEDPHYSTKTNFTYIKMLQSIDLLKKYDSVLAKSVSISDVTGCSNLRQEEIEEILYRIV